ncbi:hypothetical protein A3I27_02390 [Candidatus Giovannonibacteria bacterium RIFCSPLOWO2_02_FULL_43_11b]|uniref:DUF5667 domain-containing protein n=1 Tax=Candidatus Giovannonibacteria bacterium RIFCSPHIGHO2_12_FULL_43_15 TaxID=1798341 RepID=A0A1F5WPB8_9BACT|nr:MAG: hypothetical protein A2739_01620 [Candidatus Giovannonibacteria bacterium RIFCSPHIGHO2_01_FULL_43_100]OGF66709.1 MAG: hypothetical protein A3B97_02220 [Candidatus Giovannonibacteria bacterium RIFCSPHIGHO2_02_FULL_43_32]OGF77485.1 MAG: hypothetical protein A3F23_00715 [Candidatus Giovannonibacteria bacterium RIFCSPHIGHO2_12_FULL_43_15]OGF78856.1 MAG: hypothetical protein A3A15_00115 [Candidatus Giovannonibacteria bacterium RIFCSPLOWO2_01_FULL_43_60]OGF89061.1 MAG: hypothetical protein A3
MEDRLEKIFKKGQEIKLNPSEKEKMRDFVISYAKKNTKRKTFSIFSVLRSAPAILIFTIVFGGVGISFAAEKALPGDVLYSVKTNINEEVIGLLTVSDENKVKWLAKVAERRIEETETLVKENRFDPAAKEKIEKNFEQKAKKIKEKIQAIDEKNNLDAASMASQNLENTLEKHREILEKLSEEKSESREEIDSVLENVKSFRDSIRKSREGSERKRRLFEEKQLSATSPSATSTEDRDKEEIERD